MKLLSRAALLTTVLAVGLSGPAEAKRVSYAHFHTAQGIRCSYAKRVVTCRNRSGVTGRVNGRGVAGIGRSSRAPRAGSLLRAKDRWSAAGISCGVATSKAITCVSVANGHGFYLGFKHGGFTL